jgi:serine protease
MKDICRAIILLSCLVLTVALPVPVQSQTVELERVLVQFKPSQGDSGRGAQIMAIPNAQIHHQFAELNMVALSLPASQMEALRNDPSVLMVQPDAPRYLTDEIIPYGVENVEGRALWDANHDGVVDTGAPDGSGRLVCIIDSGVNAAHEDLAGVDFVGGYPASNWFTDGCGHGTHVAGTITAMSNGTGVVGVSPGAVSLYIVKAFSDNCGWAYLSDLISATFKCRDAGANIINMSFGGDLGGGIEEAVFNMLYNNYGILSIAAAGNTGSTAPFYPASYASVVSVAAVDQSNVVADFSQKNEQVELAAPGVMILSTYKNGGYSYMSGTSMAAPHVTAAAALVWSGDPSLTNAEIRQALQDTALDLGDAGRDTSFGYGLIRSKAAYESLTSSDDGSPTAVTVARFEAASQGDAIHLAWETATEIDVLGFQVYRAESQAGKQVLVNEALLPSQSPGNPAGATYSLVDDTVVAGTTYYYWLEAVGIQGGDTWQGPIAATLEPGPGTTYRLFVPMVQQ